MADPNQSRDATTSAQGDSAGGFRTTPVSIEGMPPSIPYIIGNEAAERFSYYGMRTILYIFMTEHLRNRLGEVAPMTTGEGTEAYHWFVAGVYFTPLLGGILADAFFGKYRTIIWLSLVYCGGHLALALDDTRLGLFIGLSLITLGAGGIKPCVSSIVGDQFGKRNEHLLSRVFGWFYLSINFGSAISTILTPELLRRYGPNVAFGVPGIFMALATVVFWLGRYKYVHVPPRGPSFLKEAIVPGEGRSALLRLSLIYIFVAMFWSLYDQSGSVWVEQAKHMNRAFSLEWLHTMMPETIPASYEVDPAQVQVINPVLILLLIPLFSFVIYPKAEKYVTLTPLRKLSAGFFVTVVAFAMAALIEAQLEKGVDLHVAWQALPFLVLTTAEVMVSVTCLEFSYTQAPPSMKSFVMSLYLLSVSAGNGLTAIVNWALQDEQGNRRITGADYYWLFTCAMLVAALVFIVVALKYRGKDYVQAAEEA
ncbi:MAG: POT family MFS transporter [Pirellulales bacterium]